MAPSAREIALKFDDQFSTRFLDRVNVASPPSIVVASEILLVEGRRRFERLIGNPHKFDRQIDRKENLKNSPSEFSW